MILKRAVMRFTAFDDFGAGLYANGDDVEMSYRDFSRVTRVVGLEHEMDRGHLIFRTLTSVSTSFTIGSRADVKDISIKITHVRHNISKRISKVYKIVSTILICNTTLV